MLQLPGRWTQLIYLCAFSFTVCSFTHFGSSETFPGSPVYLSNTEHSAVVITFIFSAKNISSKSSSLSGIHRDEHFVPLPVLLQRWSLSERTQSYKTEWSTLQRKFWDSVSVFITTSDQLNTSRSDSNYGTRWYPTGGTDVVSTDGSGLDQLFLTLSKSAIFEFSGGRGGTLSTKL